MLKKGIPLHIQISQWLRNEIEKGVFETNEKLPSENELSKKFNVSRVTIRRALQSLENDDLIYRSQGLGSFVNDQRTPHNLIRLTDFNEDMARAGLDASSEVKLFQTIDIPPRLASLLETDENSKVLQIDRLRLGDNDPVAYDVTWLPLFYGQLLKPEELKESTIYRILEEKYKIPILRGCYRITADSADNNLSNQLQVAIQTPLLVIDRLSFTISDKPVYYQKRYYRNDKVLYEMTLERANEDNLTSENMPLKEFIPVFKAN
ncbi:MAG: GntR family transcriptional regulator [Balneolaceae bacterium]